MSWALYKLYTLLPCYGRVSAQLFGKTVAHYRDYYHWSSMLLNIGEWERGQARPEGFLDMYYLPVRIGRRRQCQLDTLPPTCSNLFHSVIVSNTLSYRCFLVNNLCIPLNPVAYICPLFLQHFNIYSAFSDHLRVLGHLKAWWGWESRTASLVWAEVWRSFSCSIWLE